MTKVCMLSLHHSPLDDRIFYKEAKSLQKAGYDVCQIVAGTTDGIVYDMGNTTPINPDGALELTLEGIHTIVIPAPNNTWDKWLYKMFKGAFFKTYIDKGIAVNADIYHAHEPVSYYLALQIAKKTEAKVIFDSHESYTTGTPKERYILRTQMRKLHYFISANHLTRGYINASYPHIKSQVIYNAAQPELYLQTTQPMGPEVVFTHDGYLPFNRGLKSMLHAFHQCYQEFPFIRLKLIGATSGAEKAYLTRFISQHNLSHVITETGWLPYQKVSEALASTHIGLIAKTGTINNTIGGPPIKYFNYTAAGLAIIDVNMPETRRLIEHYKNGIITSNNTSEGLYLAMKSLLVNPTLLADLRQKSKQAFNTLNWHVEEKKLVDFYANHVVGKSIIIP